MGVEAGVAATEKLNASTERKMEEQRHFVTCWAGSQSVADLGSCQT